MSPSTNPSSSEPASASSTRQTRSGTRLTTAASTEKSTSAARKPIASTTRSTSTGKSTTSKKSSAGTEPRPKPQAHKRKQPDTGMFILRDLLLCNAAFDFSVLDIESSPGTEVQDLPNESDDEPIVIDDDDGVTDGGLDSEMDGIELEELEPNAQLLKKTADVDAFFFPTKDRRRVCRKCG